LSRSRIVIVLCQDGGLAEGRHDDRAEKNEYCKASIEIAIENDTDKAFKDRYAR
jgi:hypothetical protein